MGKPAKIKTTENDASVEDFINTIDGDQKREDSHAIIKLMQKATKEKPKMWGASIIGFGNIRYQSPSSGREVDWMKIGFSPRKANLSLYLMGLYGPERDVLLQKLGKHKTGTGCIYINKLEDIDMKVLEQMINAAVKAK
ncbi:MAG: hypothetical protein JWO03_1469 [Bacteroidetes bacterium]|nr:hypothetical protein [Bacteroidota bacterium]